MCILYACLSVSLVVAWLWNVLEQKQCMWYLLWRLYYEKNIWILLGVLASLYPCHCYGVGLMPAVVILLVWWFSCLLLLSHLIAQSSLQVQYGQMSCETSFLVDGQLFTMYSFNCCVWALFCIASSISYIDIHEGLSVDEPVTFMVILMLVISLSFFMFLFP